MESFLPGFEPDFDVRKELRFIGGMPDLHQFDRVFISCSGGKDSHAMAYVLAELAQKQNYDKGKMELIYADTGFEWHDTFEQVKRIGQAVGINAVKVLPKYTLLDNVRRRWAKFNGLEWEGDRQTDRQTDRTSPAKRWEHCKPIPEQYATILQQRPQTNTDRDLCPFPSNGIMWCRSHGKQFPIEQYIRFTLSGGGDKSLRPFPSQFARFCTAWGKQRPIEEYAKHTTVPNGSPEMVYIGRKKQHNSRSCQEGEQVGGRLGTLTVLMCSGERREESSKRATYPEWSIHEALTTRKRKVYRWRPMLDFKVADVWSAVRDSGIEAHEAYAAGCDRLGCTMCIFAGDCGRMAKDVRISCLNNIEQYEELDKLETDTGYTMSISGVRVRDIVKKG